MGPEVGKHEREISESEGFILFKDSDSKSSEITINGSLVIQENDTREIPLVVFFLMLTVAFLIH